MTDTLLYDVMGGMDKLNNISVLDFPNNTLTDECIDVFTKAMANKKITLLNLSNNKISNEGVKNLAIFIANGKSYLVTLNLSLNLIEDDGAVTLLKVWVGLHIPAAFLLPFCPSELILKRGWGVPAIIKIEHKHHYNLQCKCCHCLNCSRHPGDLPGQADHGCEPLLQPAGAGEQRRGAGPPQAKQAHRESRPQLQPAHARGRRQHPGGAQVQHLHQVSGRQVVNLLHFDMDIDILNVLD